MIETLKFWKKGLFEELIALVVAAMIRHNLKVAFDDDDNPKLGDNSSCVFFLPFVRDSIHYFLSLALLLLELVVMT